MFVNNKFLAHKLDLAKENFDKYTWIGVFSRQSQWIFRINLGSGAML